jgi:hypothetical protein
MPPSQREALSKAVAAAAAAAAAAEEAGGTALLTAASKVLPVEDEIMVCVHSGSAALSSRTASLNPPEQQLHHHHHHYNQHQRQHKVAAAPLGPEEGLEPNTNMAAAAASSEEQLLLGTNHSPFAAAASTAVSDRTNRNINISSRSSSSRASPVTACSLSGCCSSELGRSSSSRWQALLAVARNKVVLYAGCWRILHDIPGNGILYYTPMIVQAMLLAGGSLGRRLQAVADLQLPTTTSSSSELIAAGLAIGTNSSGSSSLGGTLSGTAAAAAAEPAGHHAGSPGADVVLLSAIPYAAASLFHLGNAWHSQKSGERRWHIAGAWLLGAVALLLLPAAAAGGLASVSKAAAAAAAAAASGISVAASVAAFVLLTLAHVGINGANGVQTGLVAANIVPQEKALGLAMYNTIGCFGSFWGPVIIGVLHDATGGYAVAMWLLGASLAAAAAMVARFRPERLDSRLVSE